MALGLAILLVLLVGVMGAGLLTFIRTDLEAVAQVNQGQRALNLADGGAEAAAQLLELEDDPTGGHEWSVNGAAVRVHIAPSREPVNGEEQREYYEVVALAESGGAVRVVEAVYREADGPYELWSWRELYRVPETLRE